MEIWLWAAIVILILVIIILSVKIHLLRKAALEIREAFTDRLVTDTNTLIDISTNDKYMRELAHSVNRELRTLRTERRRFRQGDLELKNAVTNISHDLRTPLTAIYGYMNLLEKECATADSIRYLKIIRDRADMLKQLTEELFCYSVIIDSKESRKTESVIVNHILEESIAAFYTALREHNITPTVVMPECNVIRNLDPSDLSRVFSNLLNNAIKYSDGDLSITLSENGEIVFSNMASGMDELHAGRLFERFYTVETARKSTGLGLSIARTLTEQMNGSISAAYKDGRLSICILLPLN